ncbi:MAG: hypothetical protein ABJ084_13335 [Halioglobus sp.]
MSLFEELRRRNVFRVAVAYVVTAWLLMQFADLVLDNIGAPAWVMQTTLLLLAIGFPVAVLLAWAFEITPEGIKRERDVDRSQSITYSTGRKLDFTIIALLLGVAVYFIWEARFADQVTEQPVETAASSVKSNSSTTSSSSESAQPPVVDDTSIAVLPFVNLSSDPEQEFFSDGISEELLNVLAQFPDLRVAARTSSFQFKGDNRDISEIAKLLKVNHVLEGSVRKSGTRLRITAQLIEADNGYHLWSETYDRELEDIFAIQDDISAAIGDALVAQLELNGAPGQSAPSVSEAANPAAYEAYLHGRHLINQRGNRAITEAVHHLERALRLDPNYAPAHAQLAIAYSLLSDSASSYGDLTTIEVNAKAQPHIDRAMELNPNLPELWGAKAQLAGVNEDGENALLFTERALELNPVYVDALNWRFNTANSLGMFSISEESIRKLIEVDPYSIVGRLNYISNILVIEDIDAAERMANEVVEVNKWAGYIAKSFVEQTKNNMASATKWALLAYAEDPLDRFSNEALVYLLGTAGLFDEAVRISANSKVAAHYAAAKFLEAAILSETALQSDPDDLELQLDTALYFYAAKRPERAKELYEIAFAALEDKPAINSAQSMSANLFFAQLLKSAGEVERANRLVDNTAALLESAKGTVAEHGSNGYLDRALVSIFRGEEEEAIHLFKKSLETYVNLVSFELPIIDGLRGNPEFQTLQAQTKLVVEQQRALTIDLICNDNPIPDAWLPLPSTCQSSVAINDVAGS